MFAKLYETKELGQILVKLDAGEGETEAEVRFYIEPPNLGVCSFACGFSDWDKAEALFNGINEEKAVIAANGLLKTAAPFAPEGAE